MVVVTVAVVASCVVVVVVAGAWQGVQTSILALECQACDWYSCNCQLLSQGFVSSG